MNEIDKLQSDSPNPDDVLAAIQSFNDPAIIVNIFQEMGWNYSLEIKETLAMVKQNANLSIKFKALKHLRELLREAAETAGFVANVSQTTPNAQGGSTTFHARRMASMLNPTKKIESIEIKEPQNDQTRETESDRRSDRGESQRPEGPGELQEGSPGGTDTLEQFPPERDTGRTDPTGYVVTGGLKPTDGGKTSGQRPGPNDKDGTSEGENPCIKTRPPTCDQKLFPGISTSAED